MVWVNITLLLVCVCVTATQYALIAARLSLPFKGALFIGTIEILSRQSHAYGVCFSYLVPCA